jgi:nickel/cobalt transporter (NicO) family protein
VTSITDLLQQGSTNFWLFVPSAIVLGVLHGLEPGHSKTMMAAFIIAVRGTVAQAILLGLSATLSHTAVVWAVALAGQYFGRHWGTEATEPYFQIVSAVLIIGIAFWIIWRTWREQKAEANDYRHHESDAEIRRINTGQGVLTLAVFEDGAQPRWRVRFESGERFSATEVTIQTIRPDGTRQSFLLIDRGDFLQSAEEIPEPHAFTARLSVTYGGHGHDFDAVFHEHDHDQEHMNFGGDDDGHARAHGNDIRRRFAGRTVTTGQIVMFGLTGGLIPCPAAITVLLLCIQLKQISLGVLLVFCFSAGLALTMVSAGVIAALSVKHVANRWSGFSAFARRAPYASGALIICVGLYMGIQGLHALSVSGAL